MKRLMVLMASAFFIFALSACGGGGGGDGDTNENSAPIANAGADQNITTGSTVTLDGGGSDADGDLLTYSWALTSKPPGSTATLLDSTVANPTFNAEVDGAYVLALTVNDGKEISFVDSVTVTAASLNSDPTANAGPDQNVATGSLVTLSGTGSDADSDLLSFSWTFTSRPSGSAATLSNLTVANPSFTADMDGTYILSLTSNDGTVNSQVDSVTVTAATLNSAPTANAGPDQNVATGDLVTLNGGGSDADADLLTYSWAFTSKPAGSTATLSDSTIANPTFVAGVDGAYKLTLTVNDGKVSSATAIVTVTAKSPDQSIKLDTTYNSTGVVTTNFGTGISSKSNAVAIQSDGKIVAAGGAWSNFVGGFALARYNTDGSLDSSFGSSGKVSTTVRQGVYNVFGYANAVAIQNDGKIVAAGDFFAVIRYNTDGSLDPSFSATRSHTSYDYATAIAIQPDGKIVVAGESANFAYFQLARYNSDGSFDTSFGTTGKIATGIQIGGVAIQSDGKIVIAGVAALSGTGQGFALARYNSNGSLDTTFNTTGKVITSIGSYTTTSPDSLTEEITSSASVAYAVIIQPNGKILAAGRAKIDSGTYFALARYNADGNLDITFNATGTLISVNTGTYSYVKALAIQSNGKIVAGGKNDGTNSQVSLVRYNTDGSLDETGAFDDAIGSYNLGYRYDGVGGIVIQNDGKIVVTLGNTALTASHTFSLLRFSGLP